MNKLLKTAKKLMPLEHTPFLFVTLYFLREEERNMMLFALAAAYVLMLVLSIFSVNPKEADASKLL